MCSMELPLPRPSTALDLARKTLSQATTTVTSLATAPVRALRILDEIESLVRRVGTAVDRAEATINRADQLVDRAEQVAGRAAAAVSRVEVTAATADELLTAWDAPLRKGAPMAAGFVDQLSPEEVEAAIRLIDELPRLTRHLTSDVLPILATLDRVGPDIHDLLDVTRDLRLAVAGIPGLKMLRRRGETRISADGEANEA